MQADKGNAMVKGIIGATALASLVYARWWGIARA
jgi:hypothetical protein